MTLYMCFLFNVDPPEFVSTRRDTFNCTHTGDNISCASYPGANGAFICSANGNPAPVITRSMSGVPTTSNVDVSTGSDIRITSVIIGNTGIYVCTAVSPAFNSTVTRTFQLFVGGKLPIRVCLCS